MQARQAANTKMVTSKSSRKPKALAKPPAPMMEIDSDQVLRAMMATKTEGKRKADSSDDGDESEDASEGPDRTVESEPGSEESADEASEAESSSMASRRYKQDSRKRSRSTSPQVKKEQLLSTRAGPATRVGSMPASRVAAWAKESTNLVKTPFTASKPPSSTTFASLGLSQPVISALASINILKPTEIQAACVGPILQGRDCIGGAKTGSGKTLAFALPIVERILRDPFGVWAVILTPTRSV